MSKQAITTISGGSFEVYSPGRCCPVQNRDRAGSRRDVPRCFAVMGSDRRTSLGRARTIGVLAAAATTLIWLGSWACVRQPSPADIVVLTPDGFRLASTVYGRGAKGVVLAHDASTDKAALGPLAFHLAQSGFVVLTFNFRGFPGSDGVPDPAVMDRDVLGAAHALVRNFGAKTVSYVGFGTGALVVAKAAYNPDFAPRSLALVGTASRYGPLTLDEVMPPLFLPKALLVPKGDEMLLSDTMEAAKLAPEPKEVFEYPGEEDWYDPSSAVKQEGSGIAYLRNFLERTAK